jgi:hypothetical protein
MRNIKALVCFILLAGTATAQTVPIKTEKELKKLLKDSMSNDHKISEKASNELLAMPESTFPVFLKFAQKEKPCLALGAGAVIYNTNPAYPGLTEAMGKIARGAALTDFVNFEETMNCRQAATKQLPYTADGLRIILAMLKAGTEDREMALFALDDLTEVEKYPKGGIEVMKQIIPVLERLQNAKGKVTHEMSWEVLDQLSRSSFPELAEPAKAALESNRRI